MRTAILFSGTAYNFYDSIASLMANLVLPNNADVFILTSRYNMRRKAPSTDVLFSDDAKTWAEKARTMVRDTSRLVTNEDVAIIRGVFGDRLKDIRFINDMPEYQAHTAADGKKMMDLVNQFRRQSVVLGKPAPFGGDVTDPENNNIRCVIDQYHHVKRCYEMMEQFEQENGFKYDFVVRARLDFIAPSPLVLSHYYLNQDPSYLYVLGSFRRDPMEWADEFCWFSYRGTAARLFPELDRMGLIADRSYNTIHKGNEYLFAPETQFSILLYELAMCVINVKIYRSARYTKGTDGFDYMNYMFRREL
jgi:hypothetical protein